MKEGKAAIEAVISFKDGNGSTTGEYPVTTEIEVKEIALDSIAFDKVIKEMLVGATDTLQVIYNPNNTTDLREVIWESSDSDIISVENDKLIALKTGEAEITETVGSKKASCKITIKEGTAVQDKNQANTINTNAGNYQKDNKKKVFITAGIIIAVLVIGAVVLLLLSNGKDNRAEEPEKQKEEAQDTEEESDEFDESEYVFPYSDKEYLTDAGVEKLTEEQLGFVRNEILARHGRIFTEEKYKSYFEEKSWYKGTAEPDVFDSNYEKELNNIEKANIEVIKNYEEKLKAFALAEQYYVSVLKEYQDAEAGGYSGDASQYPHVNSLLFGNGCSEPLYFTLSDLCGDGVPELFIGYFLDWNSSDYILMELYGYEDGSAKQLSVSPGFGVTPLGEQNFIGESVRYYICDDGLIRKYGSCGADINNVTYYELRENSVEMTIKEGAGQDGGHYLEQNYGGLGVLEATKAFYEEMQNKYPLKSDMQWYKLQDFCGDKSQADKQIGYYADILKEYQRGEKERYPGGESQYPHVNPMLYGYKSSPPLYYALIDLCDATTFYKMKENSAVLLLSECVAKTTEGYYWSDDGLSTSEATEEQYESTRNKYAVKTDIP